MSIFIKEVGQYLQSQNFGTLGVNIFLSFEPDSPDELIAVLDRGGYITDDFVKITGDAANKYDVIGVQLILRGNSYESLMSKAYQIYDLFHRKAFYNLGTFYIKESHAESLPIPIGRDERGRDEISINFLFSTFR